jgi:hypothetical protein
MFMDKLNTYNISNKHWMQINVCEGHHLCSVQKKTQENGINAQNQTLQISKP